MHRELATHFAATPKRVRLRHGATAQLLDQLLHKSERVHAVLSGQWAGIGSVIAVATNLRVVAAGPSGWHIALRYSQISGVNNSGWRNQVQLHSAGIVYAIRSTRAAANPFIAAVRSAIPSGSPYRRLVAAD